MKENELRIGNLINYKIIDKMDERQEWLEVSEIDHDDLRILGIKNEINQDYQPILLTEEWLLRFGYFKVEHKQVHFIVKGHTIWICNNLYLCEKNGIILKYVHQLQNLYFALTNEELIIKL